MNRVVRKSRVQSSVEVFDLLIALFTAELVRPSKCLWLVSPWISNVDLIDNSAGTYPVLSRFGRRPIRLAEIVITLAARGTHVVVGTTTDKHNEAFEYQVRTLAEDLDVAHRVTIDNAPPRTRHAKAVTGDDYALAGSMNITFNGIHILEEDVELKTDPAYVAQARMDAYSRFGGLL
ncbi:phospholipase D-like domain-containing protein DpdK [Crossiella sp. CA-258035]|uniref:phospholipase D-like domain-containing protein DpdK n=1 Tax=Crossiella sp. CA-258035 TaxID=2981138 RepID=UPI0024BCAAFA|nr:phospholipase D-like domain-containing protein DpdK [Crossiella sp. CA-258035]WHT23263.1 phospholipase D-like domain-containing protein DpdK [Crossiella sp. CA-258035]